MPTDLDTMCTRDLARTATLVLDALRNAPDETELFVETEFGPATVVTDGTGADVVLHDREATVHVRREN